MLKNKLSKVVSFAVAVMMIMSIIQLPTVSADGSSLTVTDTTKNAPFFDLEGDMVTNGQNSNYSGNWYALNSELSQAGKTGYMMFSFDGTKSAIINGATTKIDGKPKKLEFAILSYNWVNYAGSLAYEMSADKSNWYVIKNYGGTVSYAAHESADTTLKSKYSDLNSLSCVTQSGANRNYYTITIPETFTVDDNVLSPKYIRIGGVGIKGVCRVFAKPSITWESSAGSFSIKNSTMVYPTANDLEIDFSNADISSLTKEDLTIKEANGTVAEISEIDISENTVGVTFTEALKPYTEYEVSVAKGDFELSSYTQNFKTTPSFTIKSFSDTLMNDKSWFTTSSAVNAKPDTGNKQYYELGWYSNPPLSAEGGMQTPSGEIINGNISEVEFILGYYASSYNISSGKVVAYNIKNEVVAELNFTDYASFPQNSVSFPQGMAQQLISIPDGVLPRDTSRVALVIGQEGQTVCISRPGIKWRDYGLKPVVTKFNGKVAPLETVELSYSANIDASSVSASKYALNDGESTINPTSVRVNKNKVSLIFAEALTPEKNYTITSNENCYSSRPYGVIKTMEGLTTSREAITFTTDVSYEEKSFTDTNASYGWLILNNVNVTSVSDTTFNGWYGQINDGSSSIIFAFDNSGGKMLNNSIYRPDGIIKEIKFAIGYFNNTTSESFKISISPDGINYTDIGSVADYIKSTDSSLYDDVTFASFVQKQYVSIDSSALNLNTKYVKIEMPEKSSVICKPSVKYLIPTADYRILTIYTDKVGAQMNNLYADDITVSSQVEGRKASDDYVLVFATYNGNVLTDAKLSYSSEALHTATFKITNPQTEYIRTFLFSDMTTISPLINSVKFGPARQQ